MTKNVTIKDMFNEVIALAEANGRQDIVDFAKGRIYWLEKKNANKKPTPIQVANEAIKADIKAVLADGKARTVSEVIADGGFPEYTTTQKISALMTLLIKSGDVVKTVDKKKSYYSLAPTVTDDVDEVQALDRELAV